MAYALERPMLLPTLNMDVWNCGFNILKQNTNDNICIVVATKEYDFRYCFVIMKTNGVFYKQTYRRLNNDDPWVIVRNLFYDHI
tara:strand:- start:57 stop:308 length:252 start_codon:yes stop_codon:yes gene_type:complete